MIVGPSKPLDNNVNPKREGNSLREHDRHLADPNCVPASSEGAFVEAQIGWTTM